MMNEEKIAMEGEREREGERNLFIIKNNIPFFETVCFNKNFFTILHLF